MNRRYTQTTLTGKHRHRTQSRLVLPDQLVKQVQVREQGYYMTRRGVKVEVDNTYWRDAQAGDVIDL